MTGSLSPKKGNREGKSRGANGGEKQSWKQGPCPLRKAAEPKQGSGRESCPPGVAYAASAFSLLLPTVLSPSTQPPGGFLLCLGVFRWSPPCCLLSQPALSRELRSQTLLSLPSSLHAPPCPSHLYTFTPPVPLEHLATFQVRTHFLLLEKQTSPPESKAREASMPEP